MKEFTEKEIMYKAEAYCSLAEHCLSEVQTKLQQWGLPAGQEEKVLQYLLHEKYIDEQRYSKAFVRDKYRFNQWGRIKIIQALRLKRILPEYISCALDEIDCEEYFSILSDLLCSKNKSVKARNAYERKGKLIRFALGRGYEMGEVLECLRKQGLGDVNLE